MKIHYKWRVLGSFQLHLIVFDHGKLNRSYVWKHAFGFDNPDKQNLVQCGETYFLSDHSTTVVAIGLSKDRNGCIDLDTIVHEATHASDEFFKILKMKMDDGQSTQELRSNLCANIVCKIKKILDHEGIKIVDDTFDTIGILDVIKVK